MYVVGYVGIDENGNPVLGSGRPKTPRNSKGTSLIKSIDDYVVVDLETTGLDPLCNEIIEVAALRVRGGEIVETMSTLVNPKEKIDEFITSLTGITNEMVKGAPTIKKALPALIKYIRADVVVAHNANFDINFIYDKYDMYMNAIFRNSFIDTMRLGRLLFKDFPRHTLQELARQFGINKDVEHRALSDAKITHECYCHIKKYVADNSIDLNALRKPRTHLNTNDITTQNTEFDETTSIFGKQFVFTGTLEKMPRKDAMQYVVDMGGSCGNNVTATTNYLVMGNTDYNKVKDGKSNKQKTAEKMMLQGADIQVISENVFYDMLEE